MNRFFTEFQISERQMIQPEEGQIVFQQAISTMGESPRDLGNAMTNAADTRELDFKQPLDWLQGHLGKAGQNDEIHHALDMALRRWDRTDEDSAWTKGTSRYSADRRRVIYERLKLSEALTVRCDEVSPPYTESQTPVVIADEHRPWYNESRKQSRHYWDNYCKYLRESRGWPKDAITGLDESTEEVVSRISDPTRPEVYQAKGLVIGYVQSGKTANFTGVLAKAADAGYRFFIVLAGTMDILRDQTQRRIDKELLGKELVENDYLNDLDWPAFNSNGDLSREFDWDRLTVHAEDYQGLKQGIKALEFVAKDPRKPYFVSENLRTAPARLIVIKKIPKVLARLAFDLKRIRARLADVPTLVIDDESDQASINTVKPDKATEERRTSTNREITHLMGILSRAQYIGYTATPFANVFINPDDAEDLFPKDFILSLPRPAGYMGVADFYDLDGKPPGYKSNEQAFVRGIGPTDSEPQKLLEAIDCFVLAGALKLYREAKKQAAYHFVHHTMLVHHSAYRVVHQKQAEDVQAIFENAGYLSKKGYDRLKELFEKDFLKVTRAQAPGELMPAAFAELGPFIGDCVSRLTRDKTVRIVNGENKDDTPDFDRGMVWAILVGGAKLSRGYTVEGLTTTYFRRVASASDTLMQMGRWFGFRSGYRDLVRLFIGRAEPIGPKGKRIVDLYEAFHGMCLDDEEFRRDIRKYAREGIKPSQVPPLVPSQVTALSPTAKNKMYNAYITFRNYGGETSQRTVAPTSKTDAKGNEATSLALLSTAKLTQQKFSFIDMRTDPSTSAPKAIPIAFSAIVGTVTPKEMLKFLRAYRWEGGAQPIHHEIEFLEGSEGNPGIDGWLIVAPALETEHRSWPDKTVPGIPKIPVRTRARIGQRINVYTEPDHVLGARYIAGLNLDIDKPNNSLAKARTPRRGVMLFYAVQAVPDAFYTMGFALIFPENNLKKGTKWTVRDKNQLNAVVIDRTSTISSRAPSRIKTGKTKI
jgi:Z1 domain-containing protein